MPFLVIRYSQSQPASGRCKRKRIGSTKTVTDNKRISQCIRQAVWYHQQRMRHVVRGEPALKAAQRQRHPRVGGRAEYAATAEWEEGNERWRSVGCGVGGASLKERQRPLVGTGRAAGAGGALAQSAWQEAGAAGGEGVGRTDGDAFARRSELVGGAGEAERRGASAGGPRRVAGGAGQIIGAARRGRLILSLRYGCRWWARARQRGHGWPHPPARGRGGDVVKTARGGGGGAGGGEEGGEEGGEGRDREDREREGHEGEAEDRQQAHSNVPHLLVHMDVAADIPIDLRLARGDIRRARLLRRAPEDDVRVLERAAFGFGDDAGRRVQCVAIVTCPSASIPRGVVSTEVKYLGRRQYEGKKEERKEGERKGREQGGRNGRRREGTREGGRGGRRGEKGREQGGEDGMREREQEGGREAEGGRRREGEGRDEEEMRRVRRDNEAERRGRGVRVREGNEGERDREMCGAEGGTRMEKGKWEERWIPKPPNAPRIRIRLEAHQVRAHHPVEDPFASGAERQFPARREDIEKDRKREEEWKAWTPRIETTAVLVNTPKTKNPPPPPHRFVNACSCRAPLPFLAAVGAASCPGDIKRPYGGASFPSRLCSRCKSAMWSMRIQRLANVFGGLNASYGRQLARHRVLRRPQRQTPASSTLGLSPGIFYPRWPANIAPRRHRSGSVGVRKHKSASWRKCMFWSCLYFC
ncbi:hypothetical protein B0H14DRAFT_3708908 [Mycena olivaceomarginata]|nr:hypothetical protein B0H14DRAFT_3708908 [Mycena olivaceomarginata]